MIDSSSVPCSVAALRIGTVTLESCKASWVQDIWTHHALQTNFDKFGQVFLYVYFQSVAVVRLFQSKYTAIVQSFSEM